MSKIDSPADRYAAEKRAERSAETFPGKCVNCGHNPLSKIQHSVVIDKPNHPVAAPCNIEHCHFEELNYERQKLVDEVLLLRAYRDRNVELGLKLGALLGPTYDGTNLIEVLKILLTKAGD